MHRDLLLLPLLLLSSFFVLLSACSADIEAPAAVAGGPSEVAVGAIVTLDGSGSSDPADRPLSFSWRIAALPSGSHAILNDPTLVAPSFTADLPGDYRLELRVSNGVHHSPVAVHALSAGPCGRQAPVAAEIEATPATPPVGALVSLSSALSDPDLDGACGLEQTLRHRWKLVPPPGSAATLDDTALATPAFLVDRPGVYRVAVTPLDDTGVEGETVHLEVVASECGVQPPVVEAVQSSLAQPGVGAMVTLSATVNEPDNAAPCAEEQLWTYTWRLAAPPGSDAVLNDPELAGPAFLVDRPGAYVATLVVTDDSGRSSAPASLEIFASECGANAPEIESLDASRAGTEVDAAVSPGERIELQATVRDADNDCSEEATVLSYRWTLADRPEGSSTILEAAHAASSAMTPDLPGEYRLTLTVVDATGRSSEPAELLVVADSCGFNAPSVVIEDPDPIQPDAAGAATDPVRFAAQIQDRDLELCGDAHRYDWRLVVAPEGSGARLLDAQSANPSLTPDLRGVYTVELQVSDAQGLRAQPARRSFVTTDCGAHPPQLSAADIQVHDGVAPGERLVFDFHNGDSGDAVPGDDRSDDGDLDDADSGEGRCDAGAFQESYRYEWTLLEAPAGSAARIEARDDARAAAFVRSDLPGQYRVQLQTVDAFGNRSAPVVASAQTNRCAFHAPVVAAFAVTPEAPARGEVVAVSATVLDGDERDCGLDDSFRYQWRLVDQPPGSVATLNNAEAVAPSFVADVAGSYDLTLDIVDRFGNHARSEDVSRGSIDLAPAPRVQASLELPAGILDGDTVTLSHAGAGADVYEFDADGLLALPEHHRVDISETTEIGPGQPSIAEAEAALIAAINANVASALRAESGSVILVAQDAAAEPEDFLVLSSRADLRIGAFAHEAPPLVDGMRLQVGEQVFELDFDGEPSAAPGVVDVVVAETTPEAAAAAVAQVLEAEGPDGLFAWPVGSMVQLAMSAVQGAPPPALDTDTPSLVTLRDLAPGGGELPRLSLSVRANRPPVARAESDAGLNDSVPLGATVTLDAGTSEDPDAFPGSALSYHWRLSGLPSGSLATLNDSSLVRPSFVADQPGRYDIQLRVTDGLDSAETQLFVVAEGCGARAPNITDFETMGLAVDDGDSILEAGEVLRVRVVAEDGDVECSGRAPSEARIWVLTGPDGGEATLELVGSEGRFAPATPGTWRLAAVALDADVPGVVSAAAHLDVVVDPCGFRPPTVEGLLTHDDAGDADGVLEPGDRVGIEVLAADPDVGGTCGEAAPEQMTLTLVERPAGSLAELGEVTGLTGELPVDRPGFYVLEAIVEDATGLSSAPARLQFRVGDCGTHPVDLVAASVSDAAPGGDGDGVFEIGEALSISATVEDEDATLPGCDETQSTLYALVARPAGSQAIAEATAPMAGAFVPDLPGVYSVEVTAADRAGHEDGPLRLSLRVDACGTRAPELSAIETSLQSGNADALIETGERLRFTAVMSDADALSPSCPESEPEARFELIAAPAGSAAALIAGDSRFVELIPDLAGNYRVRAFAVDPTGRSSALQSTTVEVSSGQTCGFRAPAPTALAAVDLAPDADGVLEPGERIELALDVSDPDVDGCAGTPPPRIDYALASAPAGSAARIVQEASGLSSVLEADLPGDYRVVATAHDGDIAGLSAPPFESTIRVNACGHRAPEIGPISIADSGDADGVLEPGDTLALSTTVSDPDVGGDCGEAAPTEATYRVLSRPEGSLAQLSAAAGLGAQIVVDQPGFYTVEVNASDTTGRQAPPRQHTWLVNDCGFHPISIVQISASDALTGDADGAFEPGETLRFSAEVSDEDATLAGCGESHRSEWFLESRPDGSEALLGATAQDQVDFVPDLPGLYTLRATSIDAAGHRSDPMQHTVVVTSCGTHAPELSRLDAALVAGDGDASAESGERVRFTVAAQDADLAAPCDEAAPRYEAELVATPPGSQATLENADAVAGTFELVPDVAGDYRLRAIAVDATGMASSSQEITWTVVSGDVCGFTAPTVDSIAASDAAGDADAALEPGELITLTATVSDPDVGACGVAPAAVRFELVAAPAGSGLSLDASDTSAPFEARFTPDLPGDYTFLAVVTDGDVPSLLSSPQLHSVTIDDCGFRAPVIDRLVVSDPAPGDADGTLRRAELLTVSAAVSDPDAAGTCAAPARTHRAELLLSSRPSGSSAVTFSGTAAAQIGAVRFGGAVADGETVTAGATIFELDPAGDGVAVGHQRVDTAGRFDATSAAASFLAAVNAASAELIAVLGEGDSVSLSTSISGSGAPALPLATTAAQVTLSGATLTGAGTTNGGRVLPDEAGVYVAEVTVFDDVDGRASAPASVVFAAVDTNAAPVADASASVSCAVTGQGLVALDGSASTDSEGLPLRFEWRFSARPAGSVASLSDAASDKPTFTPDLDGRYALFLSVTDAGGLQNTSREVEIEAASASLISLQGGDGQSGTPTAVLAAPNAVLVEAQCGDGTRVPAPGAAVRWSALGASVGNRRGSAGVDGVAQMGVTLGSIKGAAVVRATLDSAAAPSVELTHTITAGPPRYLVLEVPTQLPLRNAACALNEVTIPIRAVDAWRNIIDSQVSVGIRATDGLAPAGSVRWTATNTQSLELTFTGETSAGLANSVASEEEVSFSIVSDPDATGMQLVLAETLFSDDFEAVDGSDNGFEHSATDFDDWQRDTVSSTPPGGGASASAKAWGTDVSGAHRLATGCACQRRTLTRSFDLTSTSFGDLIELRFDQFHDLRSDGQYGAGGYVAVNDAAVTPAGGEGYSGELSVCDGLTGVFTDLPSDGVFGAYRPSVLDLSARFGEQASVAWVLAAAATDGACGNSALGEGMGWYLDNVAVEVYRVTPTVNFGPGEPTQVLRDVDFNGAVDASPATAVCQDATLTYTLADCAGARVTNQATPTALRLELSDAQSCLAPVLSALRSRGNVLAGGLGQSEIVAEWDRGQVSVDISGSPAGCTNLTLETIQAEALDLDLVPGAADHDAAITFAVAPNADGDFVDSCDVAECDDSNVALYGEICNGATATETHAGAEALCAGGDPDGYTNLGAGDAHCYDGLDNDCQGDGVDLDDSDCQAGTWVRDSGRCSGEETFPGIPLSAFPLSDVRDLCAEANTSNLSPWHADCFGNAREDVMWRFGIVSGGDYRLVVSMAGCGAAFSGHVSLARLDGNNCSTDFVSLTDCNIFDPSAAYDSVVRLEAGAAYALTVELQNEDCGACNVSVQLLAP